MVTKNNNKESVHAKYEATHIIEKREGVDVDLRYLSDGQSVCYGDGKTFHWLLTKRKHERFIWRNNETFSDIHKRLLKMKSITVENPNDKNNSYSEIKMMLMDLARKFVLSSLKVDKKELVDELK